MTEAWMKRGSERQEFLDGIKAAIYEEEESTHNRLPHQKAFIAAGIDYLGRVEQSGHRLRVSSLEAMLNEQHPEWRFFYRVLVNIDGFARTIEEQMALVADLILWEATSITSRFKAPLQTQEIEEPEKVFDGHRAMDEVD